MAILNGEVSPIDEKIETFQKLPVIKNYYLVLGGGKIGTDFLQYARKKDFPFVLVIDRDENAPASRKAQVLKTKTELIDLLREKAETSLEEENPWQPFRAERKNEEENKKSKVYFYRMDMHSIPSLLNLGIPEYIIPAVPCHVVAYMLADLLRFPTQEAKIDESHKELPEIENPEISSPGKSCYEENKPVNELYIKHGDLELMNFFNTILSAFPKDVIAGSYPENGMLFFSYAKEGEICPDGCPGPRDRCPAFGRKKPKTITEYTRELVNTIRGWVFESHQMKPGIGGLKGFEFKQNILEIMGFIRILHEGRTQEKTEKFEDRVFFIATTCTCHGVLNLFYAT